MQPGYVGTTMNLSACFEYPKKSLLKSSHPKNSCQNFVPKKSFDHLHYLKSGKSTVRSCIFEETKNERTPLICNYYQYKINGEKPRKKEDKINFARTCKSGLSACGLKANAVNQEMSARRLNSIEFSLFSLNIVTSAKLRFFLATCSCLQL